MQEVDIYAESETFSTDSFVDDAEVAQESRPATPAAAPALAPAPAQDGGKHHKTEEPLVVIKQKQAPESSSDRHSTKDDVSSESGSESSDSEDSECSDSTDSTVDCLSRDPLFLVLSQYLANSKGNIVDVLCKINKNLKRIAISLEKRH